MRNSKGQFINGNIPWHTGTKGIKLATPGSVKKGQHISPRTEIKKEDVVGHKNVNWKGNKVGYYGLHTWVERQLGKAKHRECEECGARKNLTWANKSHKYLRNVKDWLCLCRKCHAAYDKETWGLASNKFKL